MKIYALYVKALWSVISCSLSPRHGVSSGCGWSNCL